MAARSRIGAVLLGLVLCAASCSGDPGAAVGPRTPGADPPRDLPQGFVLRGAETGVDFVNHTGVYQEKPFLFLSKGGGVLCLDYDGDGDVDLYAVDGNSIRVDGSGRVLSRSANPEAGNRLFRNEGGWRFTDVTAEAGVGDVGFGVSGTVGDYDNDGDADIYVCNWGANVLYRNNGDGTFTDATGEAGVAGAPTDFSTCAAFFDADNDGDLDLYVANYGDADLLLAQTKGEPLGVFHDGVFQYSGPGCYEPLPDVFYRNLGDGTFRDETARSLLGQATSYGFQPLPLDVDNDGDQDLYVANDSMANFLWVNDGTGRFTDRAFEVGVAVCGGMYPQAGMGTDAADYDQDGWLDIVVTNFASDRNTLYRNLTGEGTLLFQDVSERAGLAVTTFDKVSWGVGFRDFDQDGFLDMFVSNGHVYPTPRPDMTFMGGTYEEYPSLFRGTGPPRWGFEDVSADAGPAFRKRYLGRAACFADLDGDGDLDICVARLNQPLGLFENRLPGKGHWVKVKLVGTRSNRDAIGARVLVEAGGGRIRQMVEHRLASSFGAAQDCCIHFGLGAAEKVDALTVLWPSGHRQRFADLPAGRVYVVTEDAKAPTPLALSSD